MYTSKISIHLSAYMDDWNEYPKDSQGNSMRMISSTELA
jgi:hypothetical protein